MNKFVRKLKSKIVKIKKEKVLIPCIEGKYLENRYALITGGSSGIGYSIAEAFARNGATVIITGRDITKLKNAQYNLSKICYGKENKVLAFELDISDLEKMEKSFYNIIDNINFKIDILVNNAGVNGKQIFPEISEAEFDRIIGTNLKGTYFISQLFAKYLIKNKQKGNILFISSSSAVRPAITPYMLSKWGIKGLTLGLAKKYLPYGIIVNGIAPGNTATSMITNKEDLNCDYNLVGRFIAPEEIANFATILVSSMGKMIVGDTIYITGGSGIITYDDMKY